MLPGFLVELDYFQHLFIMFIDFPRPNLNFMSVNNPDECGNSGRIWKFITSHQLNFATVVGV